MRALALTLLAACALCGCAGNSGNLTPARFAGTYTGTWVNTTDSTDFGTSTWTVSSSGQVTGTDTDGTDGTTYTTAGSIDAMGTFTGTSTQNGEGGGTPVSMSGPFTFSSNRNLTGNLFWNGQPASTYRYQLTRGGLGANL